ncbi:MAG: protein kinase [Polyangiales bacterium]
MSEEGASQLTCLAERYELGEELGHGMFGAVYRAFDRRLHRDVAIKILQRLDGASRLSLKTEFRSAARIHHEGIVHVEELNTESEPWFVTMELLEGPTLLEWVRGPTGLDMDRVARAFSELTAAVSALHDVGQVHCDLKPANVRVVDGGVRVVDFGLATMLGHSSPALAGSPRYMAPEQLAGEAAGAASDWYAVGVMLFEALESKPPFEGRPLEVLIRKQRYGAPRLVGPHAELVAALLERDPTHRAGASELLEAFASPGSHEGPPPSEDSPSQTGERVFVGREAQLEFLHAQWRLANEGARVVSIVGEPGCGKTALLQRFLEDIDASRVFHSRCYEGAFVPFAGADSLVDQVAAWLRSSGRGSTLPANFDALVTLFPVLEGFGGATSRTVRDPVILRRNAFVALREILRTMARDLGGPLLVAADDLHWGDVEGAELLHFLTEGPAPVPMLLIALIRSREIVRQSWLQAFVRAGDTVEVGPLSHEHSFALARSLLGEDEGTRAKQIASVAQGNALLVEVLTRDDAASELGVTLQRQMQQLPPTSLRLLRSVCLAGQPVPRDAWSKMLGEGAERAVRELRNAGLLLMARTRAGVPQLEAYHDRIREAVVADIEETQRGAVHLEIARTWIDAGGEAETIARHLDAAGHEDATEWMVRAADVAAKSYAWRRAAELYAGVVSRPGAQSRALYAALGDARGHQGQGAAAAAAYKLGMGCRAVDGLEDVELLRRAAEQLMRSGEMVEGIRTLDDALRQVQLRLPRHPLEAVARIATTRAKLRMRGLAYSRRPASHLKRDELQRIDLCWSGAIGLSTVDSLRGAALQSEGLLRALRAGEPTRVARALAYEAAFQGNQGIKNAPRCDALIRAATRIAEDEKSDYLVALTLGARCVVSFHQGEWRVARDAARRAEERFDRTSAGMVKEISTVQLLGLAAATFQGDFRAVDERRGMLIADAEVRRDLFAQASFRSGFLSLASIARDDAQLGRAEASGARAEFRSMGYVLQDFFDLWAQTQFDLYEGKTRSAWARVRGGWRPFRQSLLSRLPMIRVFMHEVSARAAIAAWAMGDSSAERGALRHVRALKGESGTWSEGLALSLEASIAKLSHRSWKSIVARAAKAFDASEMYAHAATARLLLGDDEAEGALRKRGVRRPKRWAQLWFPAWTLPLG